MNHISILIVNWSRKRELEAALISLQQVKLANEDMIVIDNASYDGSARMVRERFTEVRLIELASNQGFCRANNVGLTEARGDFIALLNNDAVADPNWLTELAQAMDDHPNVGFCASKMLLNDDPEFIDSAGDYVSIAGTGGKIGHGDHADKPEYKEQKSVFGACAGAALYRREMLDDIGFFDEDFFIAQEDVDLSFRAQLMGYECLYVSTAVVYHKLNTTLKKESRDYVYYGHRNLEWVYVKNMPWPLLILTFPIHVIDVLLSFGYYAARGRGGTFLRAKWDALRGLPRMLRKRREIQRKRRISSWQLLRKLEWRWLAFKVGRWRRLR